MATKVKRGESSASRSVPGSGEEIRTRACPNCYVCGSPGQPLYDGLEDFLFGAPGKWSMSKCPNPECGLAWLDPVPVEADIGKAYAGYYTHGGGQLEKACRPVVDSHRLSKRLVPRSLVGYLKRGFLASAYGYVAGVSGLQLLLGYGLRLLPFLTQNASRWIAYVPYRKGGRLLDVGCGDGAYLGVMRNLGWTVEGVEVDPHAVSNARREGLAVHQGALEKHRFADGEFDAITLVHVLEHLHDPMGLLRECHRILKRDGTIRALVPNVESAGHRRFGAGWRGLEPPRHIHLFSAAALLRLADRAGFQSRVRTTAQWAGNIYRESAALAAHAKGSSTPDSNLGTAWNAATFSLGESIDILVGRSRGEEIILEGMKS